MEFAPGDVDPPVTRDEGAGEWGTDPTTVEMTVKRGLIYDILPTAAIVIGDDAVAHMLHYLVGTGSDYTIDFEDMIDDVPLTKQYYENEIELAKAYVETLPAGVHKFTSTKIMPNLYATKDQSYNWYFAIGGYSAWGKGVATVTDKPNGTRAYRMEFEYKFFDRYNWDGGKKVNIFGIEVTDEFMARFHREGLAREFDCYGSVSKSVTWDGGSLVGAGAALMTAGAVAGAGGATGAVPTFGAKRTYVVKPGDSLSKIAGVYYGNFQLWPKIYEANRKVVGANPNLILPGQVLVIP